MPKAEPSPAVIRISTNTILEGKFFAAGEPLPVERVADLPENLRQLVVSDLPEPEEPNEPRALFQLNTPYTVTDDNRLGRQVQRRVQREIAELESENNRAEWIEEEAANAELPAEVAQELEEEHRRHVDLQAAQAAAAARAADGVADGAIAADEVPRMYVKRGGRHYVPADKARLQPGEAVFIRQPDGHFECIGTTDGGAELPDLPTIV
jgi:hypothetical protein